MLMNRPSGRYATESSIELSRSRAGYCDNYGRDKSRPAQIRWSVTAGRTWTTMTTHRTRMTAHRRRLRATPVTTPVRHRPCQLQQSLTRVRSVSWHRGTHASHSCPAVISASASRAPTQSTNKAVAVLFAARQSQWWCVCTNCTWW